ncbi:protein kinase [Aureococcus anophagefferens]|nr:protein kinase [Aureococcus anophagefferens]
MHPEDHAPSNCAWPGATTRTLLTEDDIVYLVFGFNDEDQAFVINTNGDARYAGYTVAEFRANTGFDFSAPYRLEFNEAAVDFVTRGPITVAAMASSDACFCDYDCEAKAGQACGLGACADAGSHGVWRITDAMYELAWFTPTVGDQGAHVCVNQELTENRDNGLCAEVWPEDAAGKSFYGAVVAVAFNSNNDEYVASIYVDGVFTNGVRREWWAAPFEFGVDVCLQINEAHGSFEADWHHSDFCDGSDGACTDSSTFFVCDVAEEACVDAGYTYVPPSFVFDLDGDGLTCCGCAAGCDHSLETADKADCSYFDWDYGSGHDHGDEECPIDRSFCEADPDLPDNCNCGDCGYPACGDCDCDHFGEHCCENEDATCGMYELASSRRTAPYKTDYCECCSQWPWDADAGAAQYGSEYYMTCEERMDAGYYSLIYYFAADEQYFGAPGCDYNWWNEGLQAVCADSHQTGFVESFGCGTVCAEHSDKYRGLDCSGCACPRRRRQPEPDGAARPGPTPRPVRTRRGGRRDPTPTPAALEGTLDVSGMTRAEAEANVEVYVAAVADVYGVDASAVSVGFEDASTRRRLDSSFVVSYSSPRLGGRGVGRRRRGSAATSTDFLAAVQSAAVDAGVSAVFAAATAEAVAPPAATVKKKKQRPDSKVVPTSAAPAKAAPPPAAAPPAKTTLAASAAAGAAFTLSATETDVLGPLAGMLTGLGAVAPPPLNCCLYPFTQALAQLAVAAREVRFNKEDAQLLRQRGFEIAQKLDDVVKATAGLPTGRVEAVSRTVDALGKALQDASAFLAKFSKKGAFSKLCSGTLDARTFMLLDKRLCELSGELGSALDLQQLALQTQRFQKIEGLIQLLGQQAVDANNQAAAQRAALMCGIEQGSAVEREELSELGLKLDKLTEGVGIVISQNAQQSAAIEELKQATLAKNESAKGKALARQDKERALEAYEVGDVVALKRMSMVGVTAPKRAKMLRDFSTELAIMVKLRSPRVVQVFGVVTTDPSFLGFVVEFLEGGDLRTAIDAEDYAAAVDEAQRRRWLGDVALGMQYLYSKGVEHRDLKTLNVLLDGNRRCKVTDFGLSKSDDLNTAATQATAASGSAKGTPAYMAPELLESNTFTEKTDVYAFSMIVWEVLDGGVPWAGLNPMQVGMQVMVQKKRPPPPAGAPPDLLSIVGEEPATITQTQRFMALEVPPGAQPGMTLQATTPEGTTVQVAIPAGLAPGMRFQVAY